MFIKLIKKKIFIESEKDDHTIRNEAKNEKLNDNELEEYKYYYSSATRWK
jgi:hypothetical protein